MRTAAIPRRINKKPITIVATTGAVSKPLHQIFVLPGYDQVITIMLSFKVVLT